MFFFFFPAFKKPPPHADYSQIKMVRQFTASLSPVAEPPARPHLSTHTSVHVHRVRARTRAGPASHQRLCTALKLFVSLSFCCPSGSTHTHTHTHTHTLVLMSHTNADMAAESVVNRSLPAFHFCSKSIGLCRTQHLIEAHKVTDYWIVTCCIEGCLANASPSRPLRNTSTVALAISFVLNYAHFIAEKRKKKKVLCAFCNDYPENQLYKMNLSGYGSAALTDFFMIW